MILHESYCFFAGSSSLFEVQWASFVVSEDDWGAKAYSNPQAQLAIDRLGSKHIYPLITAIHCQNSKTSLERKNQLSRSILSKRRESHGNLTALYGWCWIKPSPYISLTSFCTPEPPASLAGSRCCLTASLQDTVTDLHASLSPTDLSLGLSKVSIAVCPSWWSAFSEHSGRRTVYMTSFILFVLWILLSAFSNSIGMLISMRVLAVSAASSVQSVGAGTIADVWEVKERGTATGIFYIRQLAAGTLLGPLLGGTLTQVWAWRAGGCRSRIFSFTGKSGYCGNIDIPASYTICKCNVVNRRLIRGAYSTPEEKYNSYSIEKHKSIQSIFKCT